MQKHSLNFEKKNNIEMAQNSTQITGIAFSELNAEKKQLVTENSGNCCFVISSIGNRPVT